MNKKNGYKNIIEKLKNNREFRDYIIWGAISAVVNVGIFQLLVLLGTEYSIANIIALVLNRFFCYVTNKLFVFKTKCDNLWELIKEVVAFSAARMVTFFIDYFGVIILVEIFGMNAFISKLGIAVVVVLSNYGFSKFYVFKKIDTKRNKNETDNTDSLL